MCLPLFQRTEIQNVKDRQAEGIPSKFGGDGMFDARGKEWFKISDEF